MSGRYQSVLLDDDFCSVTNILCCINVSENCEFKFVFCAVVTCDVNWSQAALFLISLRMRPNCSQGWELLSGIFLPSSSSSFCPWLFSEGNGCKTPPLPHSWWFVIELSISSSTFCTQTTPLLGNSLCKCSLISKCSVINLPRSCCWMLLAALDKQG